VKIIVDPNLHYEYITLIGASQKPEWIMTRNQILIHCCDSYTERKIIPKIVGGIKYFTCTHCIAGLDPALYNQMLLRFLE
jgi:hypothetical protein